MKARFYLPQAYNPNTQYWFCDILRVTTASDGRFLFVLDKLPIIRIRALEAVVSTRTPGGRHFVLENIMLYANVESNDKVEATPQARGVCPFCGSGVIAKCGTINIWHWAHEKKSECDMWNDGETKWHLDWKSKFPAAYAEIQITKQDKKHIADICFPNGGVIEFQHSPLSVKEIQERESFYGMMIWVFDIQSSMKPLRNSVIPIFDSMGHIISHEISSPARFHIRDRDTCQTFRWYHARKTIAYCKKPVYLDIGDGQLFQLKKMYPESPVGGWGHLRDKDEFINRLLQSVQS